MIPSAIGAAPILSSTKTRFCRGTLLSPTLHSFSPARFRLGSLKGWGGLMRVRAAVYAASARGHGLLETLRCRYRAHAVDLGVTFRAAGYHTQDTLWLSWVSLLHSKHKKRPCSFISQVNVWFL